MLDEYIYHGKEKLRCGYTTGSCAAAASKAAAEMLLEAKGFSDVVVSITEDNCDVVLNMGEVTDAKRAQVEDIVKRKTNIAADKIVITPIVVDESGE